MADLAVAFATLSEKIKNQLSSQETSEKIAALNANLNISPLDETKAVIIPKLILELAVQNLDPRDFIDQLSTQLDIDFNKAQELTEIIYDQILKPIESSLKEAGIDIHLMMDYARRGTLVKPQATPPTNLPEVQPKAQPPKSDKPLIIYSEGSIGAEKNSLEEPTFRYKPPLSEISGPASEANPQAKVEGLRVVHYTNFLTPLHMPNVKIPKSKWFI